MTTTIPPVPLPAGAVKAEEWQPDGPLTYRVFEGEERALEEGITVWTHGVQYWDGVIDDGTRDQCSEAPGISVDGVCWEKNLSSETARRLADLLVMAADEVDRWVQR
jgi:hypothetical protein